MDTSETVTHVSLCAGYGGIDLGLKRAIRSLRTIAFSEIEAFACANLVQKMEAGLLDQAPIWTNVKTFPYVQLQHCVDVLSGGYPCQPFSQAGKRRGQYDERHLWPWIADGIDAMRPRLCFFENVEGHISLGLSTVLSDLEAIGYTSTWGIFSAAEVGAPHQRKRVFILAYSNHAGLQRWDSRIMPERSGELLAWPSGPSEPQHEWEPPRVVAVAERPDEEGRQPELREASRWWTHDQSGRSTSFVGQAESPVGRVPYGRTYRLDELRLCGNGVVPATAELAFRVLFKQLSNKNTL